MSLTISPFGSSPFSQKKKNLILTFVESPLCLDACLSSLSLFSLLLFPPPPPSHPFLFPRFLSFPSLLGTVCFLLFCDCARSGTFQISFLSTSSLLAVAFNVLYNFATCGHSFTTHKLLFFFLFVYFQLCNISRFIPCQTNRPYHATLAILRRNHIHTDRIHSVIYITEDPRELLLTVSDEGWLREVSALTRTTLIPSEAPYAVYKDGGPFYVSF